MEFYFRRAKESDLPVIMELAAEAKEKVPDPEWFEMDDMDFMKQHISEEGFTILAEYRGEGKNLESESVPQIAGIMLVRIPGEQEDNLGEYLNLTAEEMFQVAHLEIAVVSPKFQGNQLQYRMFCVVEKILSEQVPRRFRYLMATVHPENRFSLNNMKKLGMEVAADVRKYGGKRRYVMWKHI